MLSSTTAPIAVKKLNTELRGTFGQNFNGMIASLTGALTYRFKPYGDLTVNNNYSRISTSEGEGELYLVGLRANITFTKKLFWTTFFQYNNLSNNVNSRLQWRFWPVSDSFLVYSDNYFADSFTAKNRAIIAKLTY